MKLQMDITLCNYLPTSLDCGSIEYLRDKCIGCGLVPAYSFKVMSS